jgi:1-deoxy-D-xylulose-5-phosphate synthase
VGGDGATHQGAFDLSFLRCIPNMVVMAPADENECRQMLYTAYRHDGPSAVRYPRGAGTGVEVRKDLTELPFGKAELRRKGRRIAFLAFGSMVHPALAAAEALDASLANMRWVKPIDAAMIEELARTHDAFVTVEEHAVAGGAGSACLEAMAALGIVRPVLQLGLPDIFVDHGDPGLLLRLEGLDAAGIERSVRARFGELLAAEGSPRLVASR